jgi:predicted Zn-dependent protease with MMP-like domain
MVLQAVAQLEPRWENELAGVEFAVEEVPSAEPADSDVLTADDTDPVPLARLDLGSSATSDPARPARPARIVLYRRPLLARADGDEELGDLVLEVVIEEFARLLGVDPQSIDPDDPDAP